MFGLTNSFITLRSKNVIKKDFPMHFYRNSLKSWKKNHNYCLNDLTIFSTGSEGRSYDLHTSVQRGILNQIQLLKISLCHTNVFLIISIISTYK